MLIILNEAIYKNTKYIHGNQLFKLKHEKKSLKYNVVKLSAFVEVFIKQLLSYFEIKNKSYFQSFFQIFELIVYRKKYLNIQRFRWNHILKNKNKTKNFKYGSSTVLIEQKVKEKISD